MAARVAHPGGVIRPSPWAIDDNVDRFKRGAPSSYGRLDKHTPVPDLLRIVKPQAARLRPAGAPWAVEEDNDFAFVKPANMYGAGIQFNPNFAEDPDPDEHKDSIRLQTRSGPKPPSRMAHPPETRGNNRAHQDGRITDDSEEMVKKSLLFSFCASFVEPTFFAPAEHQLARPFNCDASAWRSRRGTPQCKFLIIYIKRCDPAVRRRSP
jgi:hypothetical protein